MVEVVVVGAGAVGSSVAAGIAAAGAQVALVDAGAPGGGTSGSTFAWVNAVEEQSRDYFTLRVAAVREHDVLERELGADWLRRSGALEWAGEEAGRAALEAKLDRLRHWGHDVERLETDEVAALEPGLDLERAGVPWVVHYPGDGWAQPDRLVRALVDAAVDRGATLHTPRRVTGVVLEGREVRGVTLDGGERLPADVVVDCAGPAAAEVAALAGVALPLERRPGILLTTTPTAASVGRVLRPPDLDVRPEAGGRLALCPRFAEATEAPPPPELVDETLRRARALLPALADADAESVRVGIRPMPPDGYSIVGPLPGVDGAYVVVTHSGITLAPLLGRLVADEVVHGRISDLLEPFRPDRLATPSGASGV